MKNIFSFLLILISTLMYVHADGNKSSGGIYLGATRVIFNSTDKAAVFTVNNSSSKETWLIRSWVSPYTKANQSVDEEDAVDNFIITPPLHRLDPSSSVQLRVNRAGGDLPADRESVFYINALAIPPKSKDSQGSVIQFALNTQIKLFYRPAQIIDERELVKAYESIEVKGDGKSLMLTNSSPYYLTLTNIVLNENTTLTPADPMIPPFSHITVESSAKSGNISYQIINDFGGKTNKVNKSILAK